MATVSSAPPLWALPRAELRAEPAPGSARLRARRVGAIVTDEEGGRTSVSGLFAAGDATADATADEKAVVLAAAAGSRAAYVINADLARGLLPVTPTDGPA